MIAAHPVTIHRKVRPLRFVYFVPPGDKKLLWEVIKVNTGLWGGRYNAILPAFTRAPKCWGDTLGMPAAKEILRGYLDAFEPDYVVVEDSGGLSKLDIPEESIIKMSDVIGDGKSDSGYGLSAVHLYRNLYEKEFQYVRRHPEKAIMPRIADRKFSLFAAACFGDFRSSSLEGYYREIFEAKSLGVTKDNLLDVFTGRDITPLRIASSNLDVRRQAWNSGPTLFYMDAFSLVDIADFWNLRALGWSIFPIPKQWADGMIGGCRQFVLDNHRPLRNNPDIFSYTSVLKSRNVEGKDVEDFFRAINPKGKPGRHLASLQTWFPRIWESWAREKDGTIRCNLSAEESKTECLSDSGVINFKTVSPEFAADLQGFGSPKWANVITIRDFWPGSETADVIPPNMIGIEGLLDGYGAGRIVTTSEGIVVHCEYGDLPCRWRLPTGTDLFRVWFRGKGISVEMSSAGQIALHLIRALGGTHRASLISHKDILKILNEMAHGEALMGEPGDVNKKRKVRPRSESRERWIGILKKIHKNNDARVTWHWESLINSGVLQVGISLQCQECSQSTWYPLEQISDQFSCERCGNKFPFPSASPPENIWRYRTRGPFAVENYAQGAYSVAMALKFLTETVHGNATWATSLKDKNGKFEVDFCVWRAEDVLSPAAPTLIFGECKTYDSFRRKDVLRMRSLAKQFPGSILVFATLKEHLEPAEKRMLASLARAGRKPIRAGQTHAPVMILTSHELTRDGGPPHCWDDVGEAGARVAKKYRGYGGIKELCEATQQLHLGMESYHEWLSKHFESRRKRREKTRLKRHEGV